MSKLLSFIDEFLHRSTWKDLLSLKICFLSAGAFFGSLIPKNQKKTFAAVAAILTIIAAIPTALKLFRIASGKDTDVHEA